MIYLTFDTDHMYAEGMTQFFDTIEIPGKGTFFLWKPFPEYDWRGHEAAPHPHYEDVRDPEILLREYSASIGMDLTGKNPPLGVRTHSCVTSHMISLAAKDAGFKYTSMTTRLGETRIKPYREPWGVWELPIYYMDNMDFCTVENWPEIGHRPFSKELIDKAITEPGLYVFDFHPLHLALNSPNFSYYQSVKANVIGNKGNPFDYSYDGYGTRNFYMDLLSAMKKNGLESQKLSSLLPVANGIG